MDSPYYSMVMAYVMGVSTTSEATANEFDY